MRPGLAPWPLPLQDCHGLLRQPSDCFSSDPASLLTLQCHMELRHPGLVMTGKVVMLSLLNNCNQLLHSGGANISCSLHSKHANVLLRQLCACSVPSAWSTVPSDIFLFLTLSSWGRRASGVFIHMGLLEPQTLKCQPAPVPAWPLLSSPLFSYSTAY